MNASVAVVVALWTIGVPSLLRDQFGSQIAPSSLYRCGTGQIRDVRSVSKVVTTRAAWAPPGSDPPPGPVPLQWERKQEYFEVTVRLNGAYYVIRASSDASWNLNPMTFRFREYIDACANASEMVIDRLDGTDFRGRVVSVRQNEAPFIPPGR
jgi:hypothetical protein